MPSFDVAAKLMSEDVGGLLPAHEWVQDEGSSAHGRVVKGSARFVVEDMQVEVKGVNEVGFLYKKYGRRQNPENFVGDVFIQKGGGGYSQSR